MKKIFSVSLAVLYLALVSGGTLSLHYCGGKVASVNLSFFNDVSGCSCGSKMMKSGCCSNKKIHFTIKGEQKYSSAITASADCIKLFTPSFSERHAEILPTGHFSCITNYHAPPPKSGNSLLIWNSILRV